VNSLYGNDLSMIDWKAEMLTGIFFDFLSQRVHKKTVLFMYLDELIERVK